MGPSTVKVRLRSMSVVMAFAFVGACAAAADGDARDAGADQSDASFVAGSVVTTVAASGGGDAVDAGTGGQAGAGSVASSAQAGAGGATPCSATDEAFAFTELGTTTASSLSLGLLTVTGSSELYLYAGSMGIKGGLDDAFVDDGEYVEFEFANPATKIAYVANPVGNPDLDDYPGACSYEAFDANGASLGVIASNASELHYGKISKLFGDLPIKRFRVTATGDYHGVQSLSATLSSCP